MFVNESGKNEHSLQRTFHRCFLPNFSSFGIVVSEEKIFFRNQLIRNKNGLWWPCLFTDRNQMLPIKFRFIWPSGFRGEDFFKSTNQKQELPMVAMFANGSELNGQSLQRTFRDASYQVSVHLAKQLQRRRFFSNQPIRNKNCLWWPCLLMDRGEMSNLYRGPSIDASYQVSVHLAEGFQRRRLKCEKLTDDRRRMPSDGKSSHCL